MNDCRVACCQVILPLPLLIGIGREAACWVPALARRPGRPFCAQHLGRPRDGWCAGPRWLAGCRCSLPDAAAHRCAPACPSTRPRSGLWHPKCRLPGRCHRCPRTATKRSPLRRRANTGEDAMSGAFREGPWHPLDCSGCTHVLSACSMSCRTRSNGRQREQEGVQRQALEQSIRQCCPCLRWGTDKAPRLFPCPHSRGRPSAQAPQRSVCVGARA